MPKGQNGENLKQLGLGSLLGNTQPSPQASSAKDEQRAVMEQFRSLHETISQIAAQFPTFQPIADQMIQSSSQGMMEIVNQLAGAVQSPTPQIIG